MRPKGDQCNYNSEEAEDMENQDQSFKFGKPAADDGVNQDAEQDDSPKEHDTMPRVRLIGETGQNDQTLCHGPVQISYRGAEGLPSKDSEPS